MVENKDKTKILGKIKNNVLSFLLDCTHSLFRTGELRGKIS